MKICYFGTYDSNYSRNLINIRGLQENNVEVVFCHKSKPKLYVQSRVSKIKFLLILPFHLIYRNLVLFIKAIILIKKNNFDWIIIGFPGHLDIFTAYLLKLIFRKKIIFDGLTSLYDTFVLDRKIIKNKLLGKLLFSYEKFLYKLVDIIIVDTKENKKFYNSLFEINNAKLKVLKVGADNQIYKYVEKQEINSKFKVIFYGYASPLHGIEHIINAAKILENENIEFILIGDGQSKSSLIKQSKDLNINNVYFLPSMKENEAYVCLSSADILLGVFQNSSKSLRVIPNKVYQGIAMGKAMITSQSPAILEVFENKKNIYLCDAGNPQSLASAVLELKNNDSLRKNISKNCYNLFCEKFTPGKIGKDLIDIINSYK